MSVNPQDLEVLSVAREQLFDEVATLLSGQKYIDAVLLIEDIIGISKKIGDQSAVDEYTQKIADCIERFKSIQDDIEILKVDESLRAEIEKERTNTIEMAREATKNKRIEEAIELYERAIEFSLKLTDKKNIWKLSKIISLLKETLPAKAHVPFSVPAPSPATEVQPPPTAPTVISPPALSEPQISAPSPPIAPPIPEIIYPSPQINPPAIDSTSSTPAPAAPIPPSPPVIGPPKAPISPALSPPIASIPQVEVPKTPSATPITSVDAAASILGVEESEPESTDSFLDTIVEDLKEQPSSTVVEAPTQSVEQMVPFVPTIPEPIPLTKSTEQQIPFVPQPIDSQETEEAESSDEEEDGVKDIFDTDDKKLRKKLALAEKIAQKKLEDAEKMFKKEAKKEEKKKEKELKKQLKEKKQEEDEKKPEQKPEKLTKKDEKLKSKYPSAMPDDVLSAIRSRKRDDDS